MKQLLPLLALLLLATPATAATPVIYDEKPFLTPNSTVDLYENAVLEIEDVVPGAGIKTELIYNGTTESANVPQNDTYTFEVDGEPYVKISEIETHRAGNDNYSYARIQQYRGYRVLLTNCTAEQTDEELNVRFDLSNAGFRWIDSRLTLVAGGKSVEKRFSLGKFSSAKTRITMDWNRSKKGEITRFDLIAKVPDQKEGSGDICGGEIGATSTPTETPNGTPTLAPTETQTETATETSGATEKPDVTPTETANQETPAPGETPGASAPTETPASTVAGFLALILAESARRR